MNTLQPALDQYYRDGNQAALIEAIEKFRPAPKQFEKWILVNAGGGFEGWQSTEPREQSKLETARHGCSFVHVREVTPPDESKRWVAEQCCEDWFIHTNDGRRVLNIAFTYMQVHDTVTAHNEAMGFGKEASHG